MDEYVTQIVFIIIDRGYTMENQKTRSIESLCMNNFFNRLKKEHCESLYGLATFNEETKKICDPTSHFSYLRRRYESIKNKYEMQMFQSYGIKNSFRSKYRKCYGAIQFCANELIRKSSQFPNALLKIVVITDGTIDQSDAITVSKIANLLTINHIYLDFAIINGWVSPIVNKLAKWSGGSVFQIANQNDCNNVFGNPAFYDPRIRRYKKPKMYKINSDMVKKNDFKTKFEIDKSITSSYQNTNSKNNIKNDPRFVNAMKKIKKMEEDILKISKDIKKQISEAPNATIIFLVGNTGNGKSTFMHCMHGKRMNRLRIDNRWVLNIENMPIDEQNPLGHNGKSKTRTVDFMYVPKLNIIFVDCPGYFDSAGPDQNLINSIAINQVFNGNRSLQMKVLAFVSNDDFSERLGAIIDALNMVYGLIPSVDTLKKGLGIVITKCRKIDEKKNLKKIESITKSKSKNIDSTWEMTEYIKHAFEKQHIWSFPSPDSQFKSGPYDNFQDSGKIIEFISSNPIIDPPHSIPLDNHSFEMIIDLIHIIGNCRSLINNLFDKISQEFLLNKLNLSALKCWRCKIKKVSKKKFNSLGEFASQIEEVLPFPENYSDIFKSMNLLTIFQNFASNIKEKNADKKDITNSLSSHSKDFFCEQDIINKVCDSLSTLQGYIYESEKEEKELMMKREECARKDAEYVKAKLELWERIQIAQETQTSLEHSIEYEERKLIQQKYDLERYKKQIKRDYDSKCKRIIEQSQKEHSEWIYNAESKIDELQRKLDAEKYQNKYLNSML